MIPVTVVIGLPGAGKSTWIERQLADRPEGARWALLGQTGPASPGLLRRALGPGCACCALRPALAQALTRLLRDGPWDRLILEADGAAHPDRLVDALRAPPFDERLRVEAIVLVVDGRHPAPWLAADPDGPRATLVACASAVVVVRPDAQVAGLAAALAAAGPFGRVVRVDDGSASPPSWAPPPSRTLARWPAVPARDRRALQAALVGWAAAHPDLPVRGVWPTARAWYAWTHAPGLPDRWEVSAYRLEARLDAPAESATRAQAAAQAALLAALGPLQGPTVPPATAGGTDSADP